MVVITSTHVCMSVENSSNFELILWILRDKINKSFAFFSILQFKVSGGLVADAAVDWPHLWGAHVLLELLEELVSRRGEILNHKSPAGARLLRSRNSFPALHDSSIKQGQYTAQAQTTYYRYILHRVYCTVVSNRANIQHRYRHHTTDIFYTESTV